jgi:AcrR family transcriptional regulator
MMGRRGPKPTKADAIARAALTLFALHGVQGATTRAIARMAHTTEGNLYRYYPSKQELARQVTAACLVEFGESISHALDGVAGPAGRLAAFVRAYLGYVREHPDKHTVILDAHNGSLAMLPENVLRPRRILVDVLTDGMSDGTFVRSEVSVLASFIAGGLARMAQVDRARLEPLEPGRMDTEAVAVVLRMVGVAPPAD